LPCGSFRAGNAVLAARPEVSQTPVTGTAGRRWSGLRARILAAAVFIPCFAIITWRGEFYFVVLVNYIALAGSWEFHRLLEAKGIRGQKGTAFVAGVALPWLAYLHSGAWSNFGLAVIVLACMVQELWRPVGESLVRAAAALLGVLYVSWLASHLVLLRELPRLAERPYHFGFELVMLVFLLTWMSDTGAYTVGSLIGRHKLAPAISPGKSIEGACGGLAFAVAAGIIAARTFVRGDLSPLAGASLGAVAAIVGQLGDLAESQLKRDAHVKDASSAIPGHGGALDRFDSVLFVAPLIYYVLRFIVL
jgi:phosphatidate cytidylyltransferase